MRKLVSEDFFFLIPFAPEWFLIRYEGRDMLGKPKHV